MNDKVRFVTMSARALIDLHGIEAALVAAARAAAKLRHGDVEGARVWRDVRLEIEHIQTVDRVALRR
jgi:hypothetical protein